MLCECPVPLDNAVASRRIYSPLAYARVRDMPIAPIVHSESFRLASWFPIVWRRSSAVPDLVAVRSFLPDSRAQPPGVRASVSVLPLALQAYPFVLDPAAPPGPDSTRMFDDVVADAPTDVGASVTTTDNKLSLATELRLQALELFAQHFPLTEAVGQTLAELDLFEPWELKFNISGTSIELPDLLIVRQKSLDTGALAPVLYRHGLVAAHLIGVHRISLFRAGILLAAARAVLHGETSAESGASDDG